MGKKVIFNKFFLLVLMCLILVLVFIIFLFDSDNQSYDYSMISSSRSQHVFVKNISVGTYYSIYDIDSNTFYISSKKLRKNEIKIYSPYKTAFYINALDNNQYEIVFYSDSYYQKSKIVLVDMPIVSISTFNSLKKKENDALLDISSNESNENTNIFFNISSYRDGLNIFTTGDMHVRGGTSRYYDKKSYKVNLSKKQSFLGMNSDDDWILDSLYSDSSKVRNKLASDLWNIINDNQSINNDINGEFVEVFIDGHYNGLYILKEHVDALITGASSDGLILKSEAHLYQSYIEDFINNRYTSYNYKKDSYIGNFQVKKASSKSIDRFLKLYGNYCCNPQDYNNIKATFNIDNYINYKVFLAIIYGDDNISKNYYLSLKDDSSKLFITPWDLDLSFGNVFDASNYLKSRFNSFNDLEWLDNNIILNSYDLKIVIGMRYWELRNNGLNASTLYSFLDQYSSLILGDGANLRDSEKWYLYNYENEINIIKTWINDRFDFLDSYFAI